MRNNRAPYNLNTETLGLYARDTYIVTLSANKADHSVYNIGISATLIRRNFISRLLFLVPYIYSIYFYILTFFNIVYILSRLLLTTNCRDRIEIGK